MSATPNSYSIQTLPAFQARHFRVQSGADQGAPLRTAAQLQLENVYHLDPSARRANLRAALSDSPPFAIAPDTAIGAPGAMLRPDACLTFRSAQGDSVEIITLAETRADGKMAALHLLPLGQLAPGIAYTLTAITRTAPLAKLAQICCAAFTRGTRITLSSGLQKPVEHLVPGDTILTRNQGAQPLRWVGTYCTDATGRFAPVRIPAGMMNNENDLLLAPDHRLFVFQRRTARGAGRRAEMRRARDLIDGATIRPEPGGQVDYVQLLFDSHHIIYAEGIPVEAPLLDRSISARLPKDLPRDVHTLIPRQQNAGLRAMPLPDPLLQRCDLPDTLRRVSVH